MTILPRFLCSVVGLLSLFGAFPLSAQIYKAPADTGKIQWGHVNMTPYEYPAMCDRAGWEFVRYYSRQYTPDTSLAAILDSTGESYHVPDEGKQVVRDCLAKYTQDDVAPAHLWGYIRSALLLNEDDKAIAGIERLITEAPDSAMRDNMYVTAIGTFLTNAPRRIDLITRYLSRLDQLTTLPSPSSVAVRNTMTTYWRERYYTDSVRKYAKEAIDLIERMPFETREQVNAISPYNALITLANDAGDLAEQQRWLDRMDSVLSDWGGGIGRRQASNLQQVIDFRKTLYGKRANPITEGHWFNTQGQSWPASGKVSMIVLINHLCTKNCFPQYKTIKRLKAVFGDDLHVTLLTQSAGHSVGTLVLNEQEEGDSIVSLFTRVYDMPYTVLLDPRPISRLPDGRIIRGPGLIAELFDDWRGMNAILTDRKGSIQWMGSLRGNGDRRPMIATIRRLITMTD